MPNVKWAAGQLDKVLPIISRRPRQLHVQLESLQEGLQYLRPTESRARHHKAIREVTQRRHRLKLCVFAILDGGLHDVVEVDQQMLILEDELHDEVLLVAPQLRDGELLRTRCLLIPFLRKKLPGLHLQLLHPNVVFIEGLLLK